MLINSASDVFLCVYLKSEKQLEDKRFPPEGTPRVYHTNKTRLNRTAWRPFWTRGVRISYSTQWLHSGSITGSDRLSVLQSVLTGRRTHQALCSGCTTLSQDVMRQGREADKQPSGTPVHNAWSYTSTPPHAVLTCNETTLFAFIFDQITSWGETARWSKSLTFSLL